MNASGPFSRTTVLVLVGVGFLAFAGSAILAVLGNQLEMKRPAGTHAYSQAAIGHRALVEVLETLSIPVLVSRSRSLERTGDNGFLIVAEPPNDAKAQVMRTLRADSLLYILPKWQGRADPDRPKWISKAFVKDIETVQEVAEWIFTDAKVVRVDQVDHWNTLNGLPAPTIEKHVQLIANAPAKMHVIVGSEHGTLIGVKQFYGQKRLIISDPDILSNHGLGQGRNAELIVRVIEQYREEGVVIFDTELHGFKQSPSLWYVLFELPFLSVTIAALAACLVLVWASIGRFGSPIAAKMEQKAGKDTLIDNTASLLLFGGHMGEILGRYLAVVRRRTAHKLHAPQGLSDAQLSDWLEHVARTRGVTESFTKLERSIDMMAQGSFVSTGRVVITGVRLWKWEQEMTDDVGSRPGN